MNRTDADKPTYAQLNLFYRWIRWQMPDAKAKNAIKWAENHITKHQFSTEIARVGTLYHSHNLNEAACFDSPLWKDYVFASPINKEVANGD